MSSDAQVLNACRGTAITMIAPYSRLRAWRRRRDFPSYLFICRFPVRSPGCRNRNPQSAIRTPWIAVLSPEILR